MNRVFIDMDGVIVDFDAYREKHGLTGDEVKRRHSAYLEMEPIPGATRPRMPALGVGSWPKCKRCAKAKPTPEGER